MSTTDLSKALSLVPEIKAAYEEAEKCQRTSHSRALEYAIKAGDGLRLAKEAVGHGAFSIWRQQNLPHIPPTTATLYMRLAEHKDKFREIGNTVADLSAKGELSLRKAAALLPKRPQTAEQIAAAKATSPHASDGKSADRSAELRTPSQNSKVWASHLYSRRLQLFLSCWRGHRSWGQRYLAAEFTPVPLYVPIIFKVVRLSNKPNDKPRNPQQLIGVF